MKQNIFKKVIVAGIVSTALLTTGITPLPIDGQAHAAITSNASSKIEATLNLGNKYLGTPYEFGSNRSTTSTFDCSDFVKHIFKKAAGVTLPSSSATQASYVKSNSTIKTSWSNMSRGDLVFFMSYKGSSASSYSSVTKSRQAVTHVGIYLGNGKILHTYSQKSGGVRVDSIKGTQWEHRMIFGGSAL
ncbi:C40 family peptidase [Paenibacillus sp. GSMTC-2017]|uniref:C40 family peptidase n=1 Tax=Paenibacillus sp. GSMTC-2017 TaxID=2794350 RepID=UPI0018D8D1FA|nr:C40 family peptidase [Paenibacillus sp. GSMTC-2017]MBH5317569.1 C40 family peptidase [Paenibacillus sp. GSMTC-2017]